MCKTDPLTVNLSSNFSSPYLLHVILLLFPPPLTIQLSSPDLPTINLPFDAASIFTLSGSLAVTINDAELELEMPDL